MGQGDGEDQVSDDTVRNRSRGPQVVADVFQMLAMAVLLLGFLGAIVVGTAIGGGGNTGLAVAWGIGAGVSTVVLSAGLAFFAHVLLLLVDIRNGTDDLVELSLASEES